MPANDPLNDPLSDDHLIKARGTGDLDSLQRKVWRACRAAEQLMFEDHASKKQILKAIYALTAASAEYRRVTEAADFDKRIAALEAAAERYAQTPNLSYGGDGR